MRIPVLTTLSLAAVLSVGIAAPAHALPAVSTPIDYTLEASDARSTGVEYLTGGPCFIDDDDATRSYKVTTFQVDTDGAYSLVDDRMSSDDLLDGTAAIYSAVPDLGAPDAGCLMSFDDNDFTDPSAVPLTAGTTYYIVLTSYDGDALGQFRFIAQGPGALTLAAFPLPPTTTAVSASPASTPVGGPIELTAAVTGDSPTGTVEFYTGTALIGTADLADGAATFSTSSLAVGSHSITAVYSGDAGNAASTSAAATVTVAAAVSATVLAATPGTTTVGGAVELTASVTGYFPVGTVEFFSGDASLGTAELADGTATFSTSALAVGSHSITAVYSGDLDNAASTSAAATVTVTAAVTPVTPVVPAAPAAPAATLAATGSTPQGGGIAAVTLLALGAAALIVRRRSAAATN